MGPKTAVKMLDALEGGDAEADHDTADEILLQVVPDEVRDAYERLVSRASFWATA